MDNRKRRRPARAAEKTQRPETPEVVYTQPETMDRKKLTVRLLTLAAVVVALFVGFSIFFRVDNIVVSGNQKYSAWVIREASGIQEGDSLLSFGKAKACGKIAQELPYVQVVRIGIKLPGTVNIYIEEVEMVYSIQDQDGIWWLMTSEGRLVEKTAAEEAAKHTQIKGFVLNEPQAGKFAVAYEPEEDTSEPEEDGETEIIVTNAERLNLALEIMVQLERNGIIGQVASVDVTEMGDIQLWYGTQYQVLLGEPVKIIEKVELLKNTVSNMGGHQTGILDLTFSTTEGAAVYKPFE